MGDVHFLDVGCADASIITTDTATFLVYDARGRRVRKTVGGANTDFIYGLSGNVVAEWGPGCGSSCWTVGYVYAIGSLLAEYQSRTTFFVHKDHLGSTRMLTRMDQSVYDPMDYLPFGQQTAGDTSTTHKFTGKERDSESGLPIISLKGKRKL